LGGYAYSTPKKVEITDFIELTEKRYKKGGANSLCGPTSPNVCVIIFIEGDNKTQLDELRSVINHF
jgi:hypothetical protein